MSDDAATARRYRKRAREVRAIAEAVTERKSRVVLLHIASDYERMARLRVRVGRADRIMVGTTPGLQRTE
jgi:flavorubredoxin